MTGLVLKARSVCKSNPGVFRRRRLARATLGCKRIAFLPLLPGSAALEQGQHSCLFSA